MGCLLGVGGRGLVDWGRHLVLVFLIRARSCGLRGELLFASAEAAGCKVFTIVIVTLLMFNLLYTDLIIHSQ